MIVVTGATGFIGRRMIQRLCELHSPSSIIALVYRKDSPLERSGQAILKRLGVRMIPVDIQTGEGLENCPKSPAIVIHMAAKTETADPDQRVNDIGTKNLFEAMQPLAQGTHFIYASTISACDKRSSPGVIDETATLEAPYSEYGRRKLLTEKYLKKVCEAKTIGLSIVRVSAVHGPGSKVDGLFGSLIASAKKGGLISRVNWPGRVAVMQVENMGEVFAQLSIAAIPPPKAPNTIIAATESLSVNEMCDIIYRKLGAQRRTIRVPQAFWSILRIAGFFALRFEKIYPFALYNRLWQATLVVSDLYHVKSVFFKRMLPQIELLRFNDTVARQIGLASELTINDNQRTMSLPQKN